jgi:hypothetical protein
MEVCSSEYNSKKTALFSLPSYSPEKNSDKYLNCDLKNGLSIIPALKNGSNTENRMLMLQGNQKRIRKYFRNEDLSYAA